MLGMVKKNCGSLQMRYLLCFTFCVLYEPEITSILTRAGNETLQKCFFFLVIEWKTNFDFGNLSFVGLFIGETGMARRVHITKSKL